MLSNKIWPKLGTALPGLFSYPHQYIGLKITRQLQRMECLNNEYFPFNLATAETLYKM
jgi:hypothetical protein